MQFLFSLAFVVTAFASQLILPPDISEVVSSDGQYDAKYSNATRNRLIVRRALGGEGSASVIVEKYAPGRYGASDKLIQSKDFLVVQLPMVKEYLGKAGKNSAESTYGCCAVKDIKFENSKWKFSVQHADKKIDCTIETHDTKSPKVSCKNNS